MPRPLKPIPRPCPRCGRSIKQKYFKTCGRCRALEKRLKKKQRIFSMQLRKAVVAW